MHGFSTAAAELAQAGVEPVPSLVLLRDPPGAFFLFETTRQSGIAVVRRLFKMGPKSCLRRLKTVRRLFHPLPVEMCAMLIYVRRLNALLTFYYRAERGKFFARLSFRARQAVLDL